MTIMLQLGDTDTSGSELQNIIDQIPSIIHATSGVLDKFGPLADIAREVLEDPALPVVIDRVQTLRAMAQKDATDTGSQVPAGLGLSRAVPALDVYIWYRKYPWGPALVVGGIALVIFAMGVKTGRRKSPT